MSELDDLCSKVKTTFEAREETRRQYLQHMRDAGVFKALLAKDDELHTQAKRNLWGFITNGQYAECEDFEEKP